METIEFFYGGGGWFASVGTGAVFRKTVKTAAVLASAFLIGTGGIASTKYFSKRNEHGYRFEQIQSPPQAGIGDGATSAAAKLDLVRHVFRMSVTGLAEFLGVSRQTLYNWGKGAEPAPAVGNRLEQLAAAAGGLLDAEVQVSQYLLKRKVHQGRSLLDAIRAGAPGGLVAKMLVEQIGTEMDQRRAVEKRLADRRAASHLAAEDAGIPHLNDLS